MRVYIGPYASQDDEEPKDPTVDITIDDYDTWNLDWTLSLIIRPVLEAFEKERNGIFPIVLVADYDTRFGSMPEWIMHNCPFQFENYNEEYRAAQRFFSSPMEEYLVFSQEHLNLLKDDDDETIYQCEMRLLSDIYSMRSSWAMSVMIDAFKNIEQERQSINKDADQKLAAGLYLFARFFQGLWT